MHEFLAAHGWQPQDIPGLWRHPHLANGAEVTTAQAHNATPQFIETGYVARDGSTVRREPGESDADFARRCFQADGWNVSW